MVSFFDVTNRFQITNFISDSQLENNVGLSPEKLFSKNVINWAMYNSTEPLLFCIYFWEILQEKWPEKSYKITRWSQGLCLQCLFQTVFSCFQFKSPQVNSQKRETVPLSTLRSTLQSNCHFKSASQKAQQRLKCMLSTAVWFIRKSVEPVCCKKQQKKVPDQLLVCRIGDLWRTWMIQNWLYMSPSDSPDHTIRKC